MKTKILVLLSLIGLSVIVSSFSFLSTSCSPGNAMMPPTDYPKYLSDWEKVDSLQKRGLPKSALKVVNEIYTKAKAEENHPQFIKASLFILKLQSDFEEDFMEKAIADFEKEIAQAKSPVKQILHSIRAELYWRYYKANRYKFLNRTAGGDINSDDIKTWDLNHIMDRAIKDYMASLENPDKLKSTHLKDYDVILETNKHSKDYRPTLYDFLAHRAVDFFMNDEPSITHPAYAFELDNEDYFNDASSYANLKLKTKDSLSLKFYAATIFQELLRFHLNDKKPTALVDADLKRLKFVHQNSILPTKDTLYFQALLQVEKEYKNFQVSSDAGYLIANELYKRGQNYKPLVSDKHKWEIKEAYAKCEDIIKAFPESEGAQNCKVLSQTILKQEIQITTEAVNIPDKPFLSLVSFKNCQTLHFRLIQMDYEEDRDLRRNRFRDNSILENYISQPVFKFWSVDIPDDGDYQTHSVEVKLPALPLGYYVILVSPDPGFDYDKAMAAYGTVWISNISYISEKSEKNNLRFYLLNREKGAAMANVQVKLISKKYDYRSKETEYRVLGEYLSDKKGYFETEIMEVGGRSNSWFLDLRSGNDRLVTDRQFYQSPYYQREEKKTIHTSFFTDRSIYRPGQTIYFKGIVLEKFKGDYSVKDGFKTSVEFYDVNHQKVSEQTLTTNEYGSFQGTFTAPSGILGGQMTIKNENGSTVISVEEYKRPKFEVVFNPIEGSYKLNETVSITGNAKAYAGNNIDNAQVKYRVMRSSYFPYPLRYGYFGRFPESSEMEITHGLALTDENGKFSIQFKAIPDYSQNPGKFKPSFHYTVYADVTDINGETQSATTNVNVGSVALEIKLGIGDKLEKDTFKEFNISTVNLNGQPEPAKGTIVISRLNQPERLLRDRKWSVPDKFILGEDEFIKDFPFDEYNNEAVIENLKINEEIASIDFNTETDSIIRLDETANWEPGTYSVKVATKDIYGQKVEMTKYFILFSENAKTPPVNQMNWFHVLKAKGEPGEKAAFIIGTKDKNVHVLYEVVSKDEIISSQWMKLSNEQRKIEIPIKEVNRGGFSVNLTFVKHNRSFSNQFNVEVPFTNKELDFEFATFRNKLLPGQKEKWKIIIKGAKGDSVAAELLASMYDASLDALKDHRWDFHLYSNTYGNINWQANDAFSTKYLMGFYPKFEQTSPLIREYDHLNWFGFNYYGGGPYYSMETMDGGMKRKGVVEPVTEGNIVANDGETGAAVIAEEHKLGIEENIQEANKPSGPQIRRDFRETAFFFPALQTNEQGEVVLSFTAPESLTRWKLMGLAHTKDLKYGQFEKEILTQKDLMVVPNAPRFFREGDHISFTAKVVNLSEKDLSGTVNIRFINTRTGEDITGILYPFKDIKTFAVSKGQSDRVSWNIKIPEGIDVISYRISAEAGNISDGEENAIPVLSNRMLVTESMPLPVKGNETKTFKFKKLINSQKESETRKNFKFTLEFSSNPVWYAVQALPYVMQPGIESADNVFNRYYANSIASHLVNLSPKIKQVFDVWKNYSPDALLSNLEKNEELKSLILQETPWVLEAQNETERKHRIALLFDINRMSDEQATALRILKQKQSNSGGWPWFKGMHDSRNITQNIVTGFGHLKGLGIADVMGNPETKSMLSKAIRYLDNELRDDYEKLIERKSNLEANHLGSIQIQYLYARSYFLNDIAISNRNREAFDYYKNQAIKYPLDRTLYMQGMIALALNRMGVKSKPSEIMASIKEHALYHDELGMYWRENKGGYYWYQAPIETQALMIEAFDEIMGDKQSVEQMKIWLLKQKQTQDWKTPKATAEAIYALMLRGSDWLVNDDVAEIKVGTETIDPFKRDDTKVEAGTGYFKTSWSGGDVKPEMGNVSVINKNDAIAWGAVYWQYFEDLDKITPHESPLSLSKKLFVVRNTDAGEVMEAIDEGTELKLGDKITVRIELRTDRKLEYVHMKDMRASAFEPVNVLSGYKYGSGLGYYESTKDAATHFFFDDLRKGTYVFEYPLVVSQKGEFSNGISTIQCMYAPEFSSHSEGVRVKVD